MRTLNCIIREKLRINNSIKLDKNNLADWSIRHNFDITIKDKLNIDIFCNNNSEFSIKNILIKATKQNWNGNVISYIDEIKSIYDCNGINQMVSRTPTMWSVELYEKQGLRLTASIVGLSPENRIHIHFGDKSEVKPENLESLLVDILEYICFG